MSIAPKKLLYIGLEPDMFFEIADLIKDEMNTLQGGMNHPKYWNSSFTIHTPPATTMRRYLYLKSIVSLLETQLTQ